MYHLFWNTLNCFNCSPKLPNINREKKLQETFAQYKYCVSGFIFKFKLLTVILKFSISSLFPTHPRSKIRYANPYILYPRSSRDTRCKSYLHKNINYFRTYLTLFYFYQFGRLKSYTKDILLNNVLTTCVLLKTHYVLKFCNIQYHSALLRWSYAKKQSLKIVYIQFINNNISYLRER